MSWSELIRDQQERDDEEPEIPCPIATEVEQMLDAEGMPAELLDTISRLIRTWEASYDHQRLVAIDEDEAEKYRADQMEQNTKDYNRAMQDIVNREQAMNMTIDDVRDAQNHLRATELLFPIGYKAAGILQFSKGEALYDLTAANVGLIGEQGDIDDWMNRHFLRQPQVDPKPLPELNDTAFRMRYSPEHGME